MEKGSSSIDQCMFERPNTKVIDHIVREIELLRGPQDKNGEAHVSVDPTELQPVIAEIYELSDDHQIDRAFFDAATPFATSLVVEFSDGAELIYSLDSSVPDGASQAKKIYLFGDEDIDNPPTYQIGDVTTEDMRVVIEAYGSARNSLPARLYRAATERLIAYGQPDEPIGTGDKSLYENRPPLSFSYDLPIEQLPTHSTRSTEWVERAELNFTEGHSSMAESPEAEILQNTVTLSIQSFDENGYICETTYTLESDVVAGEDEITGTYLRVISQPHTDEDPAYIYRILHDEKMFHDLNQDDLNYLRSVIELLPDAPHMKSHYTQ